MSDLTLQLLAATQRELNNMQLRAEAAEKELAEYVEKMGYQFQETINRVMAERDDWCRTNESNLAKLAATEEGLRKTCEFANEMGKMRLAQNYELQAELEKMKSDRDQFADEADDLRAKLADAEWARDAHIDEGDSLLAKLARQHEGVKGWMRDYTDAANEADELRAEVNKLQAQLDAEGRQSGEIAELKAKLEEARAVVGRVATERDRACSRADELEDLIDTVRGESNELRDKLAEAEKALAAERTNRQGVNRKLRAQLSAAEASMSPDRLGQSRLIAERDAALARVRELEASAYPNCSGGSAEHHAELLAENQRIWMKNESCADRIAALTEALRELHDSVRDHDARQAPSTLAAVARARQLLVQP